MDVAEELLDVDHTVDRTFVERRLDDWRERIGQLYDCIARWLPAGWSMSDGGVVPIDEDLMRRFAVLGQTLPMKLLIWLGKHVGRIAPRGLWIVGANGRVDLVLPDRRSIIVDRAQSFERPQWTIMPLRDRLKREPSSAESLKATLD